MSEKYIMALDLGTTSARCVLFDQEGTACSSAQKEFTQFYPQPGWVEHDPMEIWATQLGVAQEALEKQRISAGQIEGIGIANQRETTVLWEKETGMPIYPAIVWQCRRTSERIEQMKQTDMAQKITAKTGLVPDAYFSASKIEWILQHVEGALQRAERGELLFGTMDTWLIWNLTRGQVFVTDYTNASRTMLFNIHTMEWDKEILSYFKIPECMLPKLCQSSQILGTTDYFGAPVKIAGMAGDQQAALFGQCGFSEGDVKNTYGTGCFLLMNTGEKAVTSHHGLLTTLGVAADGRPCYVLEGSVFVAGAAVQWLRDELQMIDHAADTQAVCQSVEDTRGVYIVPAFTGLGTPYWNQDARGTIVGLTRGVGKAHLIRATVESIAYQVYDIISEMEKDACISLNTLRVDGGAAANDFLLQFQSDLLGADVIRPQYIETTALGAAYLSGLAVGFWNSAEDIQKNWAMQHKFEPRISDELREQRRRGWKRAVRCAIHWAQDEDQSI
ncbi:MAG: glycerol kinase GlpK [Lachnospiraceae bacterium]